MTYIVEDVKEVEDKKNVLTFAPGSMIRGFYLRICDLNENQFKNVLLKLYMYKDSMKKDNK
jgi:hypothetical protein